MYKKVLVQLLRQLLDTAAVLGAYIPCGVAVCPMTAHRWMLMKLKTVVLIQYVMCWLCHVSTHVSTWCALHEFTNKEPFRMIPLVFTCENRTCDTLCFRKCRFDAATMLHIMRYALLHVPY